MLLFFQHPALLGLLALAGLPLLVHLLARARPPSYRFSNIEFLRRVRHRTARLRRPQDWLLLALRTLALLTLAAAFASPVLVSNNSALPGEKSTVILVIDRTASMAAREGAGSRFETACTRATRYLETTRPTTANLIWIDAEPDAVFPEPGPNIEYLTDMLKQAEPRPEAGALAAAFDLALRQLARATGHRELVVLSDFQATAWRDFSPKLPPNVTVRAERVATTAPANLAVSDIICQPADPVVGQDLTVLARVRNFSADPVRTQLTLDADGARQSQALDIAPWGEASAAFNLRPAAAAPLPLTVLTEADAFPLDNARHTVVRVRDALRLALEVPDNSAEARIFRKFAAALPWLELVPPAAAGHAPDILFTSPWTGGAAENLRHAAQAGCTVIVRPAANMPATAMARLLGMAALPEAAALASEKSAAGWAVVPEETHPAIHLFRNGDFGNPFAGTFRERLQLPHSLTEIAGARLIARYADGVPAILEFPTEPAVGPEAAGSAGNPATAMDVRKHHGGSILVWNLPFESAQTDWPVQGVFLPAIAEILLRTRPQGSAEAATTQPGSPLVWTSNDPARNGAVTLIGPANQALALTETTTPDGTVWQAHQPATPGLYRWQISGQNVDFTAVNFPDSESDLRPLEAAPGFGKLDAGGDTLARQATLAQGLPLWPWLVLTAVLCLALESLIHSRKPRPLDPRPAI